jgi:hypothetical protein
LALSKRLTQSVDRQVTRVKLTLPGNCWISGQLRPETELYFGLVHRDNMVGNAARLAAAGPMDPQRSGDSVRTPGAEGLCSDLMHHGGT